MLESLFGSDRQSTLLDSAFRDVSGMLQQSAKMFDHAIAALLDNIPLEVDLHDLDDVVDEGERMVRRTVLQHLSVQPDKDLVASLVLVSIVQDAERIGDFGRGLAELVELAGSDRLGPIRDRLKIGGDRVRQLFDECEVAFREDDSERARAVVQEARELKEQFKAITRDVAASDLSADLAVVYASCARILRRIAAHLSNICSTVSQPYDRIRQGDEDA